MNWNFYKTVFTTCSALVLACASADRFGENPSSDPGAEPSDLECETNADCWDGDPATIDICSQAGTCEYADGTDDSQDTDAAPTAQELCESAQIIEGTEHVLLDIARTVGNPQYTSPLSQGEVFKIVLDEPMRLRIGTQEAQKDLVMVLLSDCANASANRIAWGSSIYSEELPPGEYFLGLFASTMSPVAFDARYLRATHCEDAEELVAGDHELTVDGYADEFQGQCGSTREEKNDDPFSHRGDRVFYFDVPAGQRWDVTVDLFAQMGAMRHFMYLADQCGGQLDIMLQCVSSFNFQIRPDSEHEDMLRLEASQLAAGRYYVYFDALHPEAYELGWFDLFVDFKPSYIK